MSSQPSKHLVKRLYGLVGRDIDYSFSRTYFTEKFARLGLIDYRYVNFDLQTIDEFKSVVVPELDRIGGLNVTIPYKEEVLRYLDEIDPEAAKIGAVNTIKVLTNNKLKGFNTDVYGFEESLKKLLVSEHKSALILGTGGASKAVAHVLVKLGLTCHFVSRRKSGNDCMSYSDLDRLTIEGHQVIVNCTPLGTFPEVERKPDIPYEFLSPAHLLFDLIYNPAKTAFLIEGEKRGAKILNGREMLEKQADRAWEIWNS